jgi:hypothetical protein
MIQIKKIFLKIKLFYFNVLVIFIMIYSYNIVRKEKRGENKKIKKF